VPTSLFRPSLTVDSVSSATPFCARCPNSHFKVLHFILEPGGGCEILPLEEELDKFTITDKTKNSICYLRSTFLEYSLLNISNDSIKFNNTAIISRWLRPDFGFDGNNSDDAVNFKPNGDPVITVMKTLDGRDSTRISSFQFLEAVRDGAGVRLAEPYEEYLQRQMAR